jgi:hypothetical protein
MSDAAIDKLIKLGGFAIFGALIALLVWLLKSNIETLVAIVGTLGAAYGAIAYNSPVQAVRRAKGLVSVKKPTETEAVLMRAAVDKHFSQAPPAS